MENTPQKSPLNRYQNSWFTEIRMALIEYAFDHPLKDVLTWVLDEVGKVVDSPVGFYHFVESDQKTLSLQQWSTRTLREFCKAEGGGMHYGIDKAGVWVDCVHERRPVIHNDYASLPHKKGLPPGHAPVIRELVVPVLREGNVVAILGVGNKPQDYTEEDSEVVSFLADVTWEVLGKMRAEAELRAVNQQLDAANQQLNASNQQLSASIRQLQQTEQRLVENEVYLKKAQELGKIGHFNFNPETNVVEGSAELFRIFDVDHDRPLFESFAGAVHPEDGHLIFPFIDKTVKEGIPYDVEHRVRHRDSSVLTVRAKGELMATPDGPRMIGIVQDITEGRNLEEKYRQSEKMQAVGQLAGGIAHDFNNQLAGIQNFAEVIRRKAGENTELSSLAQCIQTIVKRAAGLTSQLLAYSRRGKYKVERVDVHQIISEVTGILKHSIHKKILIRQHLGSAGSHVMGDVSQLQNAILNLALNARDAMPGGGQLTFSTHTVKLEENKVRGIGSEMEAGNYVCIKVEDTGTGMEGETLKRMFEPFFTTKAPGEGTGMGLAAVYGTVHGHGGGIEVDSVPGKGTSITVYLPQALEAAAVGHKNADSQAFRKQNIRVLIVDDEEMMRVSAELVLIGLGFSVTSCRNGREAVEFYKTSWQDVDLVILDIMMPDMTGKEVFLEMKEINPDVRAVFISGYSAAEGAREALEAGVLGFIEKPFSQEALSEKIEKALEGA